MANGDYQWVESQVKMECNIRSKSEFVIPFYWFIQSSQVTVHKEEMEEGSDGSKTEDLVYG